MDIPFLKKFRRHNKLNSLNMKHSRQEIKRPKILCTGMSVINGVGIGIDNFWKSLIEGKNVIDKVKSFDSSGMNCQIACEVMDEQFNPLDWYKDKKEARRNDRYTNFAMGATKMAIEDAKLDTSLIDADRFGVIVGSGIGGIGFMEKECNSMIMKGHKRVSPFLIPAIIANTASGLIAIEFNARGPCHSVASACSTGTHAIGLAMRHMQLGLADVMICGGAEASITPLSFAGFNSLKGYNDNPKSGSRPFDAKRAGFVMGEGAGIMILETEEYAVRRNAPKIYCEMAGYGANCDAHHITAPRSDGGGLAKCIQLAVEDAGVNLSSIGYINAHGTSTLLNDRTETISFKTIFGELAKTIPISSTKSMTGHCLGAAGGIEACIAAKVIDTNIIPPTINYETPDPLCDLNYCPNKAVYPEATIESAISDTLGFGGHNAVLVLKKVSN